jgi:hypothetical protein
MSIYALNKLFYLLENDSTFRERLKSSPLETISEFSLTQQERETLTAGDVAGLFNLGVHPFLLNGLSRHKLFGVTPENYLPRIRGQEFPRTYPPEAGVP